MILQLWVGVLGRRAEDFIVVDLAKMHEDPSHLADALQAAAYGTGPIHAIVVNDVAYAGSQQPKEVADFANAVQAAYATLGWASSPPGMVVHLILGFAMQEALRKLRGLSMPPGFELVVAHTPLAGVPGTAFAQHKLFLLKSLA